MRRLIPQRLRRSSALTVRTTIAGGLALLLVAVGLGLRWPNSWWGSGPRDGTNFDYSALDAQFGSLEDGYVSSVVGSHRSTRSAGGRTNQFAPAASAAGPTLIEHRLSNDDFEQAYEARNLPFRARTDTTQATRQSSEPANCFPTGGTAWYRYRAPKPIALFADTFGSPKSTSLGVYRGTSRGSLELVGCDTNVLGNAQVGFRAGKAATYWFQVTSVRGGRTVFGLAAVGRTTIETISPSGGPADGPLSEHPEISGGGRHVGFVSWARNMAASAPDCGGATMRDCQTLYLRDRVTGHTIRVAQQGAPFGPEVGSLVSAPSLSEDARYVAFSAYTFAGPDPGYRASADDPEVHNNTYLHDRATGRTELVSRNSAGEAARRDEPNLEFGVIIQGSISPSLSADGRYVVFTSDATNMGGPPSAPGSRWNVYRRDRVTGTTRLVSTDDSGRPRRGTNCAIQGRNVSGDGRWVAYESASGLVTAATAQPRPGGRVYLWDGATGRSRLVSKLARGTEAVGSYCPTISRDGSHVGLVSRDALVPEDTNGTPDVYVYEVATDRMRRVSVTSQGKQTTDPSYTEETWLRAVTLSADGRYAAFDSAAPDLVPSAVGSTRPKPGIKQVYVHDLVTRATVLASVSSTGEPLPGESRMPYISPDATAVTFYAGLSGRLEVVTHQLR